MFTFDRKALPSIALSVVGFVICWAAVSWRAAVIFGLGSVAGSIRFKD